MKEIFEHHGALLLAAAAAGGLIGVWCDMAWNGGLLYCMVLTWMNGSI